MPSKVQSILASGSAIVAIANGDVAEIVESSGAGWRVDPGDHHQLSEVIRRAHAEGPTKLISRGASGRTFYQKHMSESVGATRLDAILRAAASTRL